MPKSVFAINTQVYSSLAPRQHFFLAVPSRARNSTPGKRFFWQFGPLTRADIGTSAPALTVIRSSTYVARPRALHLLVSRPILTVRGSPAQVFTGYYAYKLPRPRNECGPTAPRALGVSLDERARRHLLGLRSQPRAERPSPSDLRWQAVPQVGCPSCQCALDHRRLAVPLPPLPPSAPARRQGVARAIGQGVARAIAAAKLATTRSPGRGVISAQSSGAALNVFGKPGSNYH